MFHGYVMYLLLRDHDPIKTRLLGCVPLAERVFVFCSQPERMEMFERCCEPQCHLLVLRMCNQL